MEPADSIRRLGFARWYERRLMEGHAWFVSAFLCLIAGLACMEEFSLRGPFLRVLGNGVVMGAALAIGAYALDRYLRILRETMHLSELATCRACGAYARFTVISPFSVCCKKCSHEWRLIDGA
ncbi:MAG: hypothetical protein AB1452_07665 [Pseudomonadota bacterium]